MKKLNSIRTLILAGSLLLQLNTLCFQSHGAAGNVDLSFDPGLGVNGPVNVVLVQPDGKVLIAGQFTSVKGLLRTGLARLNADGSGDTTFDPTYYQVSSLALQPDGKVLVGGGGIYRLNSDGSQDTNFVANLGPDSDGYAWVYSIAVQADGKVLVAGYFYTQNGTNIYFGIARLNANGSLDGSFNPGTGLSGGRARSVALQPDGKVLIGGDFFGVNGTNRIGIARLNSNGSLDLSFNPGTGAVGSAYGVRFVVLQSDGKVLIGGDFNTVNGTNRYGIARLNSNGSLDLSFNPGTGAFDFASGYGIISVALQSDGKVLIGGPFTTVNGTNRNGIARLHANGGLDTSFNPGTGAIGVAAVALHTNGQVFIGGAFTTVNGTNRNRIARLNADGSLDGSFHPGTGVDSPVHSLVVQPDGKVLIDGFINGTNRYGRARLNVDGSVDTTFIPASFNPDLAAGFYVPCPPDRICQNTLLHFSFAVQPDGKVLVGGSYYHLEYDGEGFIDAEYVLNGLARFNANGSPDGSSILTYFNGQVNSITPQSDGKIIIVGEFTSQILRLNADGSQDYSFNPGTGANGSVSSVALQPNGKVLIGGSFSTVNGTNRNGIARLNANGSLDSTFNPGTEVGSTVFSVALQPDGKVLIWGPFTTVNGTNIYFGIARLNANGSLDSTFNPGTGVDGTVYSVALQPDGKVLIGGDFTTVNGVLRRFVARLYGDSAPSLNIARSNAFVIVSWPSPSTGFVLQQNTNLNSTNWITPSETVTDNGTTRFITVSPAIGSRFYRLFKP